MLCSELHDVTCRIVCEIITALLKKGTIIIARKCMLISYNDTQEGCEGPVLLSCILSPGDTFIKQNESI